jgi:CBS domain-containing protein
VATTKLATCAPEDEVRAALETMKQARVRRLPVVGFGGTVTGILSINDILRAVAAGKKGVQSDDVVEALQAICAHRHPAPHVVAA